MSQVFTSKSVMFVLCFSIFTSAASALDLDWHGQFRTETNWIYNYSHSRFLSTPLTTLDQGYFIPNNGEAPASFQNLFLRLTPRVIVNDNVSVFSNIWLGTPDRGIFGGDQPTNSRVNQTNTGQAMLSASLLYAQMATDFGTLSVGRVPLHYGLGVFWNTTDGFDRMPSTGDGFRLETKLGSFKLIPAMYKYRAGTNYGGAAGLTAAGANAGTTVTGSSTASDYSLSLGYNNDDEQMDLSILFARRLAGSNSAVVDPFSLTGSATGYAYNVWDFYLKKKAGIFTFGAEVPFVSGIVGSRDYSTVAGALEVDAQVSDRWTLELDGGMAKGQDNMVASGATFVSPSKFTAFSFHPDYRPAFIMFNYNMRNFSAANGNAAAASPFYNPITNAKYLALGFKFASNKWSHGVKGIFATADQSADGVAGNAYYNTLDGHMKREGAGTLAQSKSLGTEVDYTLGYQWDEAVRLNYTVAVYMPGKFWEYGNSVDTNGDGAADTASINLLPTTVGMGLNLMVKF